MAVIEYRAKLTKVTYQDSGEVWATHVVEGGKTVRIIYEGDAALLGVCQTVKLDRLQMEDRPSEQPWTPWVVKKEGA